MLQSQWYGHFQADCPNRRAITNKEIKEVDQIHLEISKKVEKLKEQATVLPFDVLEMLVLRRILHTMEGPLEEKQREHICRSWCTIKGKGM